jgi:ferrous iron transport protein A
MMTTLSKLGTGAQAKIARIHADESLFHRMSAMGLRIGKSIQVIRRASFNGPIQVRVGTTDIMLRLTDAERISIIPE